MLAACLTIGSAFGTGGIFIAVAAGSVSEYVFEAAIPERIYPFDQLQDVETDAQGNVYVIANDGNRIEQYDRDGSRLAVWQGDQHFNPQSVAVDAAGFVYAVNDDEVLKLDISQAEPVASWDASGRGIGGDGIAIDSESGILYAADYDSSVIHLLDTATGDWSYWDSFEPGELIVESFFHPKDVSVDAEGKVYISDYQDVESDQWSRIVVLDQNGQYVDEMVDEEGNYGDIYGIDVGRSGQLYATDYDRNQVIVFDSNWSVLAQFGEYGAGPGQFDGLQEIAVDAEGIIYVADRFNDRVQQFHADYSHAASWGTKGTGAGSFQYPSGIAIDTSGNVYVADTGNERVQLFDDNLNYLAEQGGYGGAGTFQPTALAVDKSGDLYITSYSELYKFSASAGRAELLAYGLSDPRGVAIDADGDIYVASSGAQTVVKLNPEGEVQPFISEEAIEQLQQGFDFRPEAIAIDSDHDKVYVSYGYGQNIAVLDRKEGTLLDANWGNPEGDAFNHIGGIALDSLGHVYVTDSATSRIQKFDASGGLLAAWGSQGSGKGQLNWPTSIAVNAAGDVFVNDSENQRIQKFKYTDGGNGGEPGGGNGGEPGGGNGGEPGGGNGGEPGGGNGGEPGGGNGGEPGGGNGGEPGGGNGGEPGGNNGGPAGGSSPVNSGHAVSGNTTGAALLKGAGISESNGHTSILVTEKAVEDLLTVTPKPDLVKLSVNAKINGVELSLPGALMEWAVANPAATLEIETAFGTITIHLADLQTAVKREERLLLTLQVADEKTESIAKQTAAAAGASFSGASLIRYELQAATKDGGKRSLSLTKGYVELKIREGDSSGSTGSLLGAMFSMDGGRFYPVSMRSADGWATLKLKNGGYATILKHRAEFRDLKAAAYAEQAITVLADRFIVQGDGAGQFKPLDPLTRAQFTAMILRAIGIDTQAGSGSEQSSVFPDVNSNSWYAGTVTEAYRLGLVQGSADGKFNPEQPLSRQEMVTMIYHALAFNGKIPGWSKEEAERVKAEFADGGAIAPWAAEAAAFAKSLGIVRGNEKEQFEPLAIANRAQGAIVIYELLRKLELLEQ
ncbi:hypothetical protein GCM10010918_45060 [Paenibacillus radicis (ex Gao et al. 2016)]|uniref:SLH domain-containing protein n=2 Tax=Paenibacillus radicis (ex Gao et al. 2016) TaxID=1737354 RepID=A0A917HKN6_9BACL|nr:hypothetical protein GCM10010918_45060 [Paenibacillus radicis (ex Gao et al. 2016)]